MKEIKEGCCVMCGKEGEFAAEETGELLCEKCYKINTLIRRDRL